MHSKPDRTGETDSGTIGNTVGFGRLAYDPIAKTYWYQGLGLTGDQGGAYVGLTNFGTKSIEDLCSILKYQITQIADDLHTRAMEKLNEEE